MLFFFRLQFYFVCMIKNINLGNKIKQNSIFYVLKIIYLARREKEVFGIYVSFVVYWKYFQLFGAIISLVYLKKRVHVK